MGRTVWGGRKGFVGAAKFGVAIFSLVLVATLFIQFILPTLAVPFTAHLSSANGTPSPIVGISNRFVRLNVTINTTFTDVGVNVSNVTIILPLGFTFTAGSNLTSSPADHQVFTTGRNLTWNQTTAAVGGGLVPPSTRHNFSFNVTLNRTIGNYTFIVITYDNNTVINSTLFNVTIRDDVVPVINHSFGPHGGISSITTSFVNALSGAVFQVNLTEDNPNNNTGSQNVSLSIQRFSPTQESALKTFPLYCVFGSSASPTWLCNASIDLAGNFSGNLEGLVFGYWFNTTDMPGNSGVNGTPTANLTFTVDTTKAIVKDTIKNNTNDLQSTAQINLSVTVTDANRNASAVFASGDTGATNRTMQLTANDGFNISANGSYLGCGTASICTITFYAVDNARNINSTTITILIDDVRPNVTTPFTNASHTTLFNNATNTSRLVKSTEVFAINVTVLDNANISNVTIGNATLLKMYNQSSGNFSLLNVTASQMGCPEASGKFSNCILVITATDIAGNTNSTSTLNITVDDTRPNVTLSTPSSGNSTTSATVNFNVTVLEQHAGTGVLQVTRLGQSPLNYTLTNYSGNWGYTNTSMPDGVYTAQFFVNDSLGNMNHSTTVTFAVDTTKPAVSSSSSNDTVVRGTQVILLNVTVTDTNRNDNRVNVTAGGVNSSMTLSVNNVFQSNSSFNAQSVGCVTGSNVNCTLVFSAADAGGNVNDTHTLIVTVDDSPPNVSFNISTSAAANATFGASISFNVSVREQNPANESVPVVQITSLSPSQAAYNRSLLNVSGIWTFTNTSMPDGVYRAQFWIFDAANNVNHTENVTFTVDTVSPVINTTTPTANGSISNANAVLFQVKLVEQNVNISSENVSVYYKGQGGSSYTKNTTRCYAGPNEGPNPPHWVCNLTVDLASILGIGPGDKIEFFFNTTSMQRQAQTATNGTASNPHTATVDSTNPKVQTPLINATTLIDFNSSFRFNISVTVTDPGGTGVSTVYASGNLGATNVSMQANDNNAYNVSTTPSSLGCPTAKTCQITFLANDTAGNLNTTTYINITVDNVYPNVTTPFTNTTRLDESNTSKLFKGADPFRLNATVLENFNISNVTFGNATRLGGTNATNGNWSRDIATPDSYGCPVDDGVRDNCIIRVIATDNATNSNASVTISITVDDLRPNVTLLRPSTGANTSNTTFNFNVTILEPNPGSALVEISQGSAKNNYSLTNRSGDWGYTNTSIGEGVINITFYVNDSLGNQNFSVTSQISIDRTNPTVFLPAINVTNDQKSTFMFNLTVNVSESNRIDGNINASGNAGATNLTLTLGINSTFNRQTNGSALGCGTAGICTITIYARDAAGNINGTSVIQVSIDDVIPNVTTPFTNGTFNTLFANAANTSRLLKGTDPFRLNATILDNANVTNVTFGNATRLGGTNATNGNWSRDATPDNYGCPDDNGFLNNCMINITATDNATNSNASLTIFITVDDIRPNVTLSSASSPLNITNTTSRVMNFNVTVLEPNVGSGVVSVTSLSPSQSALNYSLTNRSGSWGYTNTSMPNGVYLVQFFINDSLGNQNFTVNTTFTISIDVQNPNVTITSPTNTTISATRTVNFNATVLEVNPLNGTVQVTPLSAGQTALNYSLTNRSGDWGYTNTSMPDGTYRAQFFLRDTEGNINHTQNVTFTITLDTNAPNGSFTSILPNVTAGGGLYLKDNVTINFTISDSSLTAVQIMFQNSSGNFTITGNTTNQTILFNTSRLADGNYTLVLNATDSVNNTNHSIARQSIVVDNTQPLLTQWKYDFRSRNLTLIFNELANSNDLVITSFNVTPQNDSNPATVLGGNNNGLSGASFFIQNATQINITLTQTQDDALRDNAYSGIWKLYAKYDSLRNILGHSIAAISSKAYGNLTDYYILRPAPATPFAIGISAGFDLPRSLLDDNEANITLQANFSVTKVLDSINNNYNAIYACNQCLSSNPNWTSFVASRPTNDFLEFGTDNTTYYLNMTKQDRLEIGQKITAGE